MNVTLIGADGSGKSTISKLLVDASPLPIKRIYMGINLNASNYVLPTTWLIREFGKKFRRGHYQGGPPDPDKVKERPKSLIKRFLADLKTTLRFSNLILEEWYRQIIAWWFQLRGYLVLFDRHFYLDYYAHHIGGDKDKLHPVIRFHGYMLSHLYPKPKLVIFLDAPAEVLFARKQEGSIELLEYRRQEYMDLMDKVDRFEIVNVEKPVEEVAANVIQIIMDYYGKPSLIAKHKGNS